jgi:deoxyribodipyrimidine photolyase
LKGFGSSILVKYVKPIEIYRQLLEEYELQNVYTNRDYEPYAKERDQAIKDLLKEKGIQLIWSMSAKHLSYLSKINFAFGRRRRKNARIIIYKNFSKTI